MHHIPRCLMHLFSILHSLYASITPTLPSKTSEQNTFAFPTQSSTLAPEEVNVCKLLHLLHVAAQRDLLVVEQRPALAAAFR